MKIILAFDNDEAGRKATLRNIKILQHQIESQRHIRWPIFWVPSQKKYAGRYGLYSQEDIEWADKIEKEWKQSQRPLSTLDLLTIFPEAKSVFKRQIPELKSKLNELIEEERETINYYADKPQAHWLRDLSLERSEEERHAIGKRLSFIFSVIHPPRPDGNRITETDIARAKEVPIETLYSGELRKQGNRAVGRCDLHNERTASFTIYLVQNTYYCYGCNAGGDVIDYIQRKRDCDFIEAVRILINKPAWHEASPM